MPSAVIHGSDAHASQRAERAARSHRSSRGPGAATVQPSPQVPRAVATGLASVVTGRQDIRCPIPNRRPRTGPARPVVRVTQTDATGLATPA